MKKNYKTWYLILYRYKYVRNMYIYVYIIYMYNVYISTLLCITKKSYNSKWAKLYVYISSISTSIHDIINISNTICIYNTVDGPLWRNFTLFSSDELGGRCFINGINPVRYKDWIKTNNLNPQERQAKKT